MTPPRPTRFLRLEDGRIVRCVQRDALPVPIGDHIAATVTLLENGAEADMLVPERFMTMRARKLGAGIAAHLADVLR